MEVFARNILKQEFYDEFVGDAPDTIYAQIFQGATATINGFYSCLDMALTATQPNTPSFLFLSPGYGSGVYCMDWKNAIMKTIFVGLGNSNGYIPEFGYYKDGSTHLLVSVDTSNSKFCIKQNNSIKATTDLLYEANKTYVAMLTCNETGDKASLIIGDYPAREDFRNVKMRIIETTITAPAQKFAPVFGASGMNSGHFRWDFWGFSVERLPIEIQ